LVAGYQPTAAVARDIFGYAREHLAPYQRIRRLQFGELPKTISGKIRRVELRRAEEQNTDRAEYEFLAQDFE
jgi:acetyl-CoA synthetase